MTLRRLTLEVAADGVAAAEAACWALGVQGLCVRDAETGRRDGRAEVVAWLDGEADGEAVRAQIAARAPAATVRLEPEDATTWTATLPTEPLRVGPIVIAAPGVAVHDPAPVLRLEPGLAFGSGAHPTTALCIDRLMSLRPRRALDVGTGTGVLALVCVLRGAREVIAVDVDPGSRAAARRHAALNDAADRVRVVDALPPAEPGFDVVVANLYVGPLASLAAELVARVAPGGDLVLAGLGVDHAAAITARYADLGLGLAGRSDRDGWACLHLRRVDVDARPAHG